MNIFLNNFNHTCGSSSVLKSSGTTAPFYSTIPFHLSYFYYRTGFSTKFLLHKCRSLSYMCILDLISGISLTTIIPILST